MTSAGFAPQSLAGRNILIVDDDIDGRHMVRAVLRQAGASVVDVASADAALAHLSTNRPDLVITDLAMPQVDGYALAEQIRRQTPGLKIVALSAFPARRLSPEQAQLFDDFIAKPAEPQHLVDSIRRLLGGGS